MSKVMLTFSLSDPFSFTQAIPQSYCVCVWCVCVSDIERDVGDGEEGTKEREPCI